MYDSHFGFVEAPFSVTPDPRFFYSNRLYQEAYANLQYGIEAKKGFIVITGEVGTGKTTLLRKLMRNLNGSNSVFVFNTHLSFPELLQLILDDLGLIPKERTKLAMLREVNDYLISQLKQGHTVAVLIDEAQSLSDETLEAVRLLSNLETDQEKLLQIVLMGQPELEARLDQAKLRQLKQRVALQCRLAPLKDEEVGSYIDFRLRAVGYQGEDLFNRDAVQQIAFYSKGIPRLINIICDNALLNAYAASEKIVSPDVIAEVARDLRLASDVQIADAKSTPATFGPETERELLTHEVSNRVLQQKVRRTVSAAVTTFMVIVIFVAVASMIDPQNFLSIAERRLQAAQHNLSQWILLLTHQEVVPEKVNTEVESNWKEQRVIIQAGSTISKIATDAYGANSHLGMDLIKEFNPQIKDLNWVSPGQDLLLPPLTQQTMLRMQSDGSYRLIVASFRSITGADEYARLLRDKGYQVIITPKRVSKDLVLHRIEIAGLKDLEEANRAWVTEIRNRWFAFVAVGNPTAERPGK